MSGEQYHECALCCRKVGIQEMEKKSEIDKLRKNFQLVKNLLNLNLHYGGEVEVDKVRLCEHCTQSTREIFKLYQKVKRLKHKLKELVEDVKLFISTSKQETESDDTSRLTIPEPLSGLYDDDPLKVMARTRKFNARAGKASKRRRMNQILSDSDSDDQPLPQFLHTEDNSNSCIEAADVEVQIKEEVIDAFFIENNIEQIICDQLSLEPPDFGYFGPTENINFLDKSNRISNSDSEISFDEDSEPCGTVPAKVKVRTKKRTPFFQELPDGRLIHEQYEVVKLEQGFKCVTCGTICKDRVYIQGHIKRVHLNDLAEFICDACGKVYSKRRSLQKHKLYFHTLKEKLGPCKVCGKPIKSVKTEQRHWWTHLNQEELEREISAGKTPPSTQHKHNHLQPCRYCGKMVRKYFMSKHEKLHFQGSDRSCHCDKCPKTYKTNFDLKRHQQRVHVPDKERFQCPTCFKTFTQKRPLEQHMKVHSDEKPFECSICGKGFKRESYLVAHAITHSKERPYKCEICSKAYRFDNSLRRHKREGCEKMS